MDDTSLDGFVKLNDAQIKTEESRADIAGKLADAAIKWQQANKASLQNLRLLLNIEWDDVPIAIWSASPSRPYKKSGVLKESAAKNSASCCSI